MSFLANFCYCELNVIVACMNDNYFSGFELSDFVFFPSEPFLRILYSRSEAASHIEKVSPKPIAVRDLIEQLSYYIQVVCIHSGH